MTPAPTVQYSDDGFHKFFRDLCKITILMADLEEFETMNKVKKRYFKML